MNKRLVALAAAVLLTSSSAFAQEGSNTVWWEHVNVDVLWPSMQSHQNGIYGLIGMHVTTKVKGRFQIFTLPGVMVLNVPAADGSRVWKVATNYGIGYKLFDLTLPGHRPAEFHVSFAKTYIASGGTDLLVGKTVDFVGFSLSFKRAR
jgi:hypothetical protein